MDLIRLEQITKTYRLGEVDLQVLNGVSLSIGSVDPLDRKYLADLALLDEGAGKR